MNKKFFKTLSVFLAVSAFTAFAPTCSNITTQANASTKSTTSAPKSYYTSVVKNYVNKKYIPYKIYYTENKYGCKYGGYLYLNSTQARTNGQYFATFVGTLSRG